MTAQASRPGRGVPTIGRVAEAIAHLRACLRLQTRAPGRENRQLAAAARDRLALLVVHLDEAAAAALVEPWEASPLRQVFGDPVVIDSLLALPPPAAHMRRAGSGLAPGEDRGVLAGMLLHRPYRLPGLAALLGQPRFDGLLLHYVAWHPKCFDRDDERDAYIAAYIALCDALAARLAQSDEPLSPLIDHCVGSLRSGAVYSCEGHLRAFAEAKGRLICAYVRRKHGLAPVEAGGEGAAGEGVLPPAVSSERPLRLGLLWNDVDPRTENFVGVASARHLRRHGYCVVSIIHHEGYFGAGTERAATLLPEIAALSDEIINLDAMPHLKDKAAAIAGTDLDCLVFMNNVTFGYNEYVALATLRLARRQAVNFCAVFTTGFPAIDLYLSGALSEAAPDAEAGYTERLVRLPGTCLIFDRGEPMGGPVGDPSRPPAGPPPPARATIDPGDLRDAGTTTLFASGANFYKLHPVMTDTWARVLAAVPDSRLVLYPFNPNWDTSYPIDPFVQRFARQLAARDVDPARVTIAGPWRSAAAVPALLSHVDVYLDSFPHSGGQSSLDALRLTIPVVTKRGPTQRENQSADLLDLLGLSDRVASDVDGYVATATALARDVAAWAGYKAAIARAMLTAPFFDTDAYAEAFARTLRGALLSPAEPDAA